MALPKQKDLDKKEKFKLDLQKSLGKSGGKLTEAQQVGHIRGAIRKAWMRSPVKLLKLELARIPDMDPKTRSLWLGDCEKCKNRFKLSELECDHIVGEHPMKTFDDIHKYADSILNVTVDDLQLLCHDCHQLKTYCERHNVDEELGKVILAYIAWEKPKSNTTAKQKEFLISLGFKENEVSNGDKRRAAFLEYYKDKPESEYP